jgi:membrane protein implicated in regulation of membrane protease activity
VKFLLLAILSVCFVVSATALTPHVRTHAPPKIQTSAGLTNMMGTVQDGDKLRFVTDQRAWNVDNPETLRGHEGHYVRVTAHFYRSKDSIHVSEVTQPTASETRKDNRK